MSIFFNGRQYITPTTVSAVNDTALANQNDAAGNTLAILGISTGGQPNVPLAFGSPAQAAAVLQGGELLTAVQKAFSPSAQTGGPAQVIAVRVDPATQSALILYDANAAAAINLTSADYGQYTSGVAVSVQNGSTTGKLVQVQYGQNYFTQDNLTRTLLQLQYSGGAASAQMSITGAALSLYAPAGTLVATIPFATYTTIQSVVAAINSTSGFNASVQGGNSTLASANAFDYVTAVDVRTAPYNALAVLQAVIDWLNSGAQPYVTATRATNAGLPPANISTTYLSGGSDGTTTNTNWSNAYTVLQSQDVQWVLPVTSSATIHAMNDAHCQYMSTIGQNERRGIVGMSLGSSDAAAIAEALTLNSDRTGLVHIGHYGYNSSGAYTLYPPYMTAALVIGGFAGVTPGTAMTNKTLSVAGLERILTVPTETDTLISAGVMPIIQTKTGYKVAQSVSTWLVNDNYNRVELSCGAAVDYASIVIRAALDPLRGGPASPTALAQAVNLTEAACRALSVSPPTGPGVLVGNAASPAYQNIVASAQGDVIAVSLQISPVIPDNFITISISAVPFSGSISA